MDLDQVDDRARLKKWLDDKPSDWAQVIASRIAMKTLPSMETMAPYWLKRFAVLFLRANVIAWVVRNIPASNMSATADAAYLAIAGAESGHTSLITVAAALDSIVRPDNSSHVTAFAVESAANIIDYNDFGSSELWQSTLEDCRWLVTRMTDRSASRILTRRSLWHGQPPRYWLKQWDTLTEELLKIDPNFCVWMEWFNRRIKGERAGFAISGDKYRIEDKKILIRLAKATDEDFWSKGYEFVNATLKGWLDEARKKARPMQVHVLKAQGITTGPPEIGSPTLTVVQPLPPPKTATSSRSNPHLKAGSRSMPLRWQTSCVATQMPWIAMRRRSAKRSWHSIGAIAAMPERGLPDCLKITSPQRARRSSRPNRA